MIKVELWKIHFFLPRWCRVGEKEGWRKQKSFPVRYVSRNNAFELAVKERMRDEISNKIKGENFSS